MWYVKIKIIPVKIIPEEKLQKGSFGMGLKYYMLISNLSSYRVNLRFRRVLRFRRQKQIITTDNTECYRCG